MNLWHGIFWKIISCGSFAAINVLVRYLAGGSPLPVNKPIPIYTIMFFQNLIGALIMTKFIHKIWAANPKKLHTKAPFLHALRIITAALGIALWYYSLKFIPVTTVVALSFIAPMLTIIGAVIFLGENFDTRRKLASFLSIVGGFLITRPDLALFGVSEYGWYVFMPLLAATVFALDKILTRKLLAKDETPEALAWYLLAFMVPISLAPALLEGLHFPEITALPFLISLGVLGAFAHYSFNKAYQYAEITALLPFGISKILISGLLSYLAFHEAPNETHIWIGVIIITFSSVLLNNSKIIKDQQTLKA